MKTAAAKLLQGTKPLISLFGLISQQNLNHVELQNNRLFL